MGRFKWVASALLLWAGLAAPAHAVAVIVNFTGVITQGTDSSGYFTGTESANLTTEGGFGGPPPPGNPLPLITGTFSYDSDSFPADPSGFYSDGSNWLDFSITIAGTTYSFDNISGDLWDYQAAFVADEDPVSDDRFNLASQRGGADGAEDITIDLAFAEFLGGNGLPSAFTYEGTGGGTGTFALANNIATADASFSITCASNEIICPLPDIGGVVPEPAVWMNLILGFGLLGAFVRRSRGRPSIAT